MIEKGTNSKSNIPDVDHIEGFIFIPETVEDITDFESIISGVKQCEGITYVRLCGGCGIGEWTRSRPITYLSVPARLKVSWV